jgi:hypothetical protein
MASKKTVLKKPRLSRKIIINEITPKLTDALSTLKQYLGEKKFNKRVKKATKLLVEGIKLPELNKEPKETPKKKATKTAVESNLKKVTKAAS